VVVLAFVIPLALLIQQLARGTAMAAAEQESQGAELLVSSLHGDPRLPVLISDLDSRTPTTTTVVTPTGLVLGSPISPDDADVARGRQGETYKDNARQSGGVVVRSVLIEGSGTYVIVTHVTKAELNKGVQDAWLTAFAIGIGLTLISVVAASMVAVRISGPLGEVASVAHQLRNGNLSARAEPTGTVETRELAEGLNGLADRITELLAAERAAVGEMAHRLRTPITALRLDAEAVADTELSARLGEHIVEVQRAVDLIVKEARRGVRDDMVLACDAAKVVRERIAFWSALAEDQGRPFRQDVPRGSVQVAMPAPDLVDVIDICIDNVFAHTAEGVAFGVTLVDGDEVVLVVTDEGPGFATPHSSDAADDEVVGRSGVGLQIVERLATGFGGSMRTSAPGVAGATVTVSLPTPR
jgi:signal transduction histidine kinase